MGTAPTGLVEKENSSIKRLKKKENEGRHRDEREQRTNMIKGWMNKSIDNKYEYGDGKEHDGENIIYKSI